ncbi:MAG: hypothetical protein U0K19_02180 [Bifidobacteriaceae bacterium]|nr:hypothetical protein [Bifidobacteriaceae bacterium]
MKNICETACGGNSKMMLACNLALVGVHLGVAAAGLAAGRQKITRRGLMMAAVFACGAACAAAMDTKSCHDDSTLAPAESDTVSAE